MSFGAFLLSLVDFCHDLLVVSWLIDTRHCLLLYLCFARSEVCVATMLYLYSSLTCWYLCVILHTVKVCVCVLAVCKLLLVSPSLIF